MKQDIRKGKRVKFKTKDNWEGLTGIVKKVCRYVTPCYGYKGVEVLVEGDTWIFSKKELQVISKKK